MPVRKKKEEESFDWTPLKKIAAFLIMTIVTAIGTYLGFNPEEETPKKEDIKIETPTTNFSGNGNTNLNNSTINNVNNVNNTTNTNTVVKKEIIQPTQIIQKEIIIERDDNEDFGSVGGQSIDKLEIKFKSINDYSINSKSNLILILDEDYPSLNLWRGQTQSILIDGDRLVFNSGGKTFKSQPINFIGNGSKIILIEE